MPSTDTKPAAGRIRKGYVDTADGQVHYQAVDGGSGDPIVMLIGAMATRNFRDIRKLLGEGRAVTATDAEQMRVVDRGLAKKAPFHRNKNSVADAMLIELYATARHKPSEDEHYCFVTSNWEDFSVQNGDRWMPHPDVVDLFDGITSKYSWVSTS